MSISKKIRFEIFKRDKFTCQYCGHEAPDIVLELDHIHPVSKGGPDDILNYVTSCRDCNQGKSNRLLSDDAVIKKRKRQLDELQERREQLEMLMDWHSSLIKIEQKTADELAGIWDQLVPGYSLTETGVVGLRKWLKRFSVSEIVDAMQTSVAQYLIYENQSNDPVKPTHESVEKAWKYVPRICNSKRRQKDKPYLKSFYYTRGILRNRIGNWSKSHEWRSIKLMEAAYLKGWSSAAIQDYAKETPSWGSFHDTMVLWAEGGPVDG